MINIPDDHKNCVHAFCCFSVAKPLCECACDCKNYETREDVERRTAKHFGRKVEE